MNGTCNSPPQAPKNFSPKSPYRTGGGGVGGGVGGGGVSGDPNWIKALEPGIWRNKVVWPYVYIAFFLMVAGVPFFCKSCPFLFKLIKTCHAAILFGTVI